jgi:hypothetical protein
VAAFILTRAAYLLIVFFIPWGWAQLLMTIFLVESVTMYMAYHMPMYGKWSNRIMLFNLCSLMGCLYHMICFTDFVDKENEYRAGFSFLLTILVFICVNLLFASWELIGTLIHMAERQCGCIRSLSREKSFEKRTELA